MLGRGPIQLRKLFTRVNFVRRSTPRRSFHYFPLQDPYRALTTRNTFVVQLLDLSVPLIYCLSGPLMTEISQAK